MPKIYYKCSYCHKKIKKDDLLPDDLNYCHNCWDYGVYRCQHNYWWELLWIGLKYTYQSIRYGNCETQD